MNTYKYTGQIEIVIPVDDDLLNGRDIHEFEWVVCRKFTHAIKEVLEKETDGEVTVTPLSSELSKREE